MQGLLQDHVCLLAIDSAPIECKEHQLLGRTQVQSCAHHLTAHHLAFCTWQGNSLCLMLHSLADQVHLDQFMLHFCV